MMDMEDVTGQPRPTRDIEAALACITREIVHHPMALAKNGEPLVMHYLVIRDVLREYLTARVPAEDRP